MEFLSNMLYQDLILLELLFFLLELLIFPFQLQLAIIKDLGNPHLIVHDLVVFLFALNADILQGQSLMELHINGRRPIINF
mmetsp:Transcript_306/g.340  ORF Transcript_306/g.340 Transcript_306/m.340 type:complete len:81 (-) Transcript_306:403-645(-)